MLRRSGVAGLAAVVMLSVAGSGAALAKECKQEVLKQAGEPYLSKALGAYPNSLIAWRKAAEAKYGKGWQAWRHAQDRKIDCTKKAVPGKKLQRWVCVRTARACLGTGSLDKAEPFPGKLRSGASGQGVTTLQRLLTEAGFDVEKDGKFGPKTLQAVRDFQKNEGIKIDGIVGKVTWDRLNG
ncbi:MAG: peptidoglycan-binding domain-containing protein [Hyphomicrobiaceae bacterium]|nr:peptidoglycan-binding domain-containing protein [Hyphomicrobiaceae bacterium]